MRTLTRLSLSLLLAAGMSLAHGAAPKDAQPLPEVPPPPPGVNLDAELEPSVTISNNKEDKVEEFRMNGRLYMLKVTPVNGPAYYLVDEEGKGTWARRDNIGPDVRPPMWLIKTW